MTKTEIIADITGNVTDVITPIVRRKAYTQNSELWGCEVLITTGPKTAQTATQEFFWNPETDTAVYSGAERKDYAEPEAEPEAIDPFERAKSALDATYGEDNWTYVFHKTDVNGTLVTVKVGGVKRVLALKKDNSVISAKAE